MNADMELYNKKFGTEAQLYNTKVKYVYNQNGKKTFVESTLILSRRHIVIISNKEHFFKEIIIRNIKGYTLSDKFMSAVVELIYGDNQFEFNSFVDENEETIYNELDKLINNNTKKRGNIDGLVIEIMIREYKLEIDAIQKETYTQFDIRKKRKRSNIPNGKELCIRQNNIIKNKCIYNENVVT